MSKSLLSRRRVLGAVPAMLAGVPFRQLIAQGGPSILTNTDGVVETSITAGYKWVRLGASLGHMYTYNGVLPGPVIEARAGDTVRLAFANHLPEATNLHFHGLHISPSGNADNVFLEIPPGEEFHYEFAIPGNHPAGMFWYHPHLHGAVARQLFRGLAGVILVRGELDKIPEVAAAAEYLMVLQDFGLNRAGEVAEPSMMERMNGREGPLITVTGVVNPAITIQAGGLARLRILNASPSRFYRLRLDDHPMYLIGTDGGALPASYQVKELLLSPGERADVLLKGDRAGGDFRLWNLPYDRGGMGMGGMGMGMAGFGNTTAPIALATLRYEGRSETAIDLPQRLTRIEPLPPPPSGPRQFVLSESGIPGRGMRFLINGREFDHHRIDTQVRLGSVEDWEILNMGSMDHPFHVHTNPFQVLDEAGLPQQAWKDVVLVPARQRRRIRIRFEDFAGRTVYHCHILDHEDLGMMGTLEFVDRG